MNNTLLTKASARLTSFREAVFPQLLLRVDQGASSCRRWSGGNWQLLDSVPEPSSLFEQRVLLVPDRLCFFQLREFPSETLDRASLNEAVELDLARWVPWSDGYDYHFWPRQNGQSWKVAVWVWLRDDLDSLCDLKSLHPTHVMPEKAWKIAAINASSFLLFEQGVKTPIVCTAVTSDFSQLLIAELKTGSDIRRLRHSLPGTLDDFEAFVDGVDLPEWCADINALPVRYASPGSSVIRSSRLQGVQDWKDPVSWAAPTAVVIGLYLFWLLGTGLVYTKHASDVAGFSERAGSVSADVLDARARVAAIDERVRELEAIRDRQSRITSVLASLSEELPDEAWLEHFEYRGEGDGWIEITGKSTQSARLAAQLETLPEVESATFMSEIRRDPATGLEPFKIRMKLTGEES